MKKAFVTVVPEYKLAYAAILMRSTEQYLPGYERIAFIIDSDEFKLKEIADKGILRATIFSAETLYGDDFKEKAFFFEEKAFIELTKVKAIEYLFKDYDCIFLADDNVVFQAAPVISGEAYCRENVVSEVIQHPKVCDNLPGSFLSLNGIENNSEVFQVAKGDGTSQFVKWCLSKFDLLFRNFCASPLERPRNHREPDDQTDFIYSWQRYASVFDTETLVAPIAYETLSSAVNITDFEDLVFIVLPHIKKQKEDQKCDQRRMAATKVQNQMVEDYYGQIAKLQASLNLRKDYRFDYFDDGVPVFFLLRPYFIQNYRLRDNCKKDPFGDSRLFTEISVVTGEDEAELPLTAAAESIWFTRADLRQAFPDYRNKDRVSFINWFLTKGKEEYKLPREYIAKVAGRYDTFRKAGKRSGEETGITWAKPGRNSAEGSLGINLVGFIRGDFGLGEATRILARSLDAGKIPFTVVNYEVLKIQQYDDREWEHKISNRFEYGTSLCLINVYGIDDYLKSISPKAFKSRYNIGCFYWELPEMDTDWAKGMENFDEIWAASDFNAETYRKYISKPVFVLPCCIKTDTDASMGREYFGLPKGRFLFLMMYDSRSRNQRKNPDAAIKAFLKAFGGRDDVSLVIKMTMPAGWLEEDDLIDWARQCNNIIIVNRTMTKVEVNSLILCCDAFVSLHRSEGFGLGPAEAMNLGKPVVLTNWSGNTVYMKDGCCCPVDYRLIEIEKSSGPYKKGWHWADPSIDHAAEYMKRLVEDNEYYRMISQNARNHIHENFSPEAIGRRARDRLDEIGMI